MGVICLCFSLFGPIFLNDKLRNSSSKFQGEMVTASNRFLLIHLKLNKSGNRLPLTAWRPLSSSPTWWLCPRRESTICNQWFHSDLRFATESQGIRCQGLAWLTATGLSESAPSHIASDAVWDETMTTSQSSVSFWSGTCLEVQPATR